jgi:hypothetical protein
MTRFRDLSKTTCFRTLVWHATWLAAVLASSATSAQTTIFSEGFNDAESTTFVLEGSFIRDPNNMWSPIPGFQRGLPNIAYWEAGDLMHDGVTPFPAKRATFFAESQTGDRNLAGETTFLTGDGFALLDAAVNWLTDTDGSTPLNIQFVVEDALFGEPFRTFDFAIRDHLAANGHTVTITDQAAPYSGTDDLVFLAAHNNDDGLDTSYPTANVPILSGYFHQSGGMGFASGRGENTNNTTKIDIVPGMESHPLAAGFSGEVTVIDPAANRQRLTQIIRGTATLAASTKVVTTTQRTNFTIPLDPVTMEPTDFTGFEGAGYLRGGDSADVLGGNGTRAYQPASTINTASVDNPRLLIDLGAIPGDDFFGPFEDELVDPDNFDFLDILVDDNNDGTFESVAKFTAHEDFNSPDFGRLALKLSDGTFSTVLGTVLQTLEFPLPSAEQLVLRIEVRNQGGDERVAIDNLRVIGEGGLLGDLNSDGEVNDLDTAEFESGFGTAYTGTDLLNLQRDFGKGAASLAAVPEPTACWLALTAAAGLMARRRS